MLVMTPCVGEPILYNCHTHLFTSDHLPPWLLGWPVWLTRTRLGGRLLVRPLVWLGRRFPRSRLARYASLARLSRFPAQADVFEELRQRYPASTRFVVLPMDLAFMGDGHPPHDLDRQHRELIALRDRLRTDTADPVLPFFALDPRRPGALDRLREGVERDGFRGVKLYPNLGYRPTDDRLTPVWEYANARGLPVITHCSRGGIHGIDPSTRRRVTADTAADYTAPRVYAPLLERYPNLRLCLAHFGGEREWNRYMREPWADRPAAWVRDIMEMMKTHPNLYTDVSYTVFYFQEFAPALKVFLQAPEVRRRVLFGSDFYMSVLDGNERMLSINLRAVLGEELFWDIAHTNPTQFLGPEPAIHPPADRAGGHSG